MEQEPFDRDQAEKRLRERFAVNEAFGKITEEGGIEYQGHFQDPFGVVYHALSKCNR